MDFHLSRYKTNESGVFGYLTFDDQSLLTLENAAKLIPAGTYNLTVSYSPHLEEPTPILLNVPGRTEIRIHAANVQTQLSGCVAVGESAAEFGNVEGITNSRVALSKVMAAINADLKQSTIEIINNFMGGNA